MGPFPGSFSSLLSTEPDAHKKRRTRYGIRLAYVENANVQGEYYLTDLVQMAVGRGWNVQAVTASDPMEFMGVNTDEELEAAEEVIAQRTQGH